VGAVVTEEMLQVTITGFHGANTKAGRVRFAAVAMCVGLVLLMVVSAGQARAAAPTAVTSWSDGEASKARQFNEADYSSATALPRLLATLSPKSPNRTVVLEWHKGGGEWVIDDTQKTRKGIAKLRFNPLCKMEDGSVVWCDQRYNYRVRILPASGLRGFSVRQFLVQFKSIAGTAAPAATAPATTAPAVTPVTPVTPLPTSPGSKFLGCRFGGKQLWGKIFAVDNSWQADAKIFEVSSSWQADLKVQQVANSWEASSCGKWYFVANSWEADLKVYFVGSSWQADVKVATVAYSPGLN
jgi:hypothetical protein